MYWPFYVPYKLYGTVDFIYSPKAYYDRVGFTGSQGFLNVVETGLYIVYMWMWWNDGRQVGESPLKRRVHGRKGSWMLVLGFAGAVMTLSKTALYCEFGIPISVEGDHWERVMF